MRSAQPINRLKLFGIAGEMNRRDGHPVKSLGAHALVERALPDELEDCLCPSFWQLAELPVNALLWPRLGEMDRAARQKLASQLTWGLRRGHNEGCSRKRA